MVEKKIERNKFREPKMLRFPTLIPRKILIYILIIYAH